MSLTTAESIERSGDAGGTEVVVVPSEYRCARCGYPSGASASVVCPECGWRATLSEVNAEAERAASVAAWVDSGMDAAIWRWAAVIAVYSLGAAAVGRSLAAVALVPLLLLFAVGLSANAGWVVSRLQTEDLRAYTRMIWQRSLWRLHLPWLVAPVFVVLGLLVGMIDVWGGDESGGVYWAVVTAGFWLWLIGCLVAFVVWWTRYIRLRAAAAPGRSHLGPSEAAAFVLGVMVVLGASGLGFAAGVLAATGVYSWLGFEKIWMV